MKKKKPINKQPFIHQVRINVAGDGKSIRNVQGFPTDFNMAMEIMEKAQRMVASHFIDKAKAGELDEFNRIKQSNIIIPKKGLILPH